ncbi:uncharacterized protein JN550_011190 [Neoarthrinium moseri]|uniref:uncharacterized protein n=1 Tax=Neoarthrinium moseri TaxID=1658444 RepID=UPI001FDD25A7|nr:uncharacterized protein JN550_011190 [Neoarthrinium moseri]KAI1860875.1 hypothetical protein JN550_011190 [Neoarthrinium moseri]
MVKQDVVPWYKPLPFYPTLEKELQNLGGLEGVMTLAPQKVQDVLTPDLVHEERVIGGPDNNDLTVSIFRRAGSQGSSERKLGIYDIHGGGMITGTRFTTAAWALHVVRKFDAVCVTIEYRLAPAHPDPAPVKDCYAGLVWLSEHAAELQIDPCRILISGCSAGGGLAAGVALLARDRDGPSLIGQMLMCPMLDDRSNSVSAYQMDGLGVWDRKTNLQGWTALLGDRRGTKNVSIYASPARSRDLSRLPPVYIDVGSCETFRDEDVQYASGLWKDGVQCELHVWPGGFHGSDMLFPTVDLSVEAIDAKMRWLQRLLTQLE